MKILQGLGLLGLVMGRVREGTVQDESPLIVLYYENWAGWVRAFSPSHVEKNFLSRNMPVRNFVLNYAFYTWNYNECSMIAVDTIDLQCGDKGGWTNSDWNIETQEDWVTKQPAGGHLPAFMMLKSRYPYIKLMPSIGGWSRSNTFHDCLRTHEDVMINSVVDHVTVWGWDGVDLDWEYPNCDGKACGCQNEATCLEVTGFSNVAGAGDWALYIDFVKKLRVKFNALEDQIGRRLYITAAVGMNPKLIDGNNDQWSTPMPVEWICEEDDMDWVNLMAYDFYGPWSPTTGPLAPLYPNPNVVGDQMDIDTSLNKILARCSHPEKLTMGLATYGKVWHGVPNTGEVPGLWQTSTINNYREGGTWESGTLSYFDIKQSVLPGCTRTWDNHSQTPTLYCATLPQATPTLPDAGPSPTRGQANTFVSYEDGESWKAKMAYARAKGLSGAIIWAASDTGNGEAYAPECTADLFEGLLEGWFGSKVSLSPAVKSASPGAITRWTDYPCPLVPGFPTGAIELDTSRCKGKTYPTSQTYIQVPKSSQTSDIGKNKMLIIPSGSVPTQTPAVPTQAPTVPNQAPTVPTQAPTIPTQAPTLPTQAPTLPTQAPIVPTQAPTVPTQAPTVPPQAPVVTTTTAGSSNSAANEVCKIIITSAPQWLDACKGLCDYYYNSAWCPTSRTGTDLAACVSKMASYCLV